MARRVNERATLAGAVAAMLLAAPVLAVFPAPALGQAGASWTTPASRVAVPAAPLLHKVGILDIFRGRPAPQPAPQQYPQPYPQQPPYAAPVPEFAPPAAIPAPAPQERRTPAAASPTGGTYRTLCVRTCDGYYFPISFRVGASKFRDDAATCLQRCGGADTRLFVYRNPGQEPGAAVDLRGNRYADLENAFRYRKELVSGCNCNADAWQSATGDRN